jgi:hypothetical protein
MLLPLVLIILAILAALIVAYGTEPVWASLGPHGLDLIIWSRRLEWPAIVIALMLCAGLLFVVISAKRRIWWLIGLLPVLVLIYHRFTAGPARGLFCAGDPPFVSADTQPALASNSLVIGVIVNGQPIAFPCSQLFRAPVVVRTDREKPLVLFWSASANRALALLTDRDVRAEDLEIICSPDNALLVYNTRLGEFINGITGKTFKDQVPTGFHDSLPVLQTTWKAWETMHPDTQVMAIAPVAGDFSSPLPERETLPGKDTDDRRITFIATTQPIALTGESITDKPLNLSIGKNALLVARIAGQVRAFNRELPGELVPCFYPVTDAKHPAVAWIDSDTNSEWNTKGEWVTGPTDMHGTALAPVLVADDLYLNEMRFWYPDLHLVTDTELTAAKVVPVPHRADKPTVSKRRPHAR